MNNCIINIKLGKKDLYAIWLSGEQEELVTKNFRVLLFSSEAEAAVYAKESSLSLESTLSMQSYDLDALEAMCECKDMTMPDFELLRFWELFCDCAYSTNASFASDGRSFILNDIYDKLCMQIYADLDDSRFDLDESEYELLSSVLLEGIRMFNANSLRVSTL